MRRPLSKYFKVTVKQFGGDFTYQNLHRCKQRKEIFKKYFKIAKNLQNRCPVPKQSVLQKNCGLLTSERFGDDKQKISPNLAKKTDF